MKISLILLGIKQRRQCKGQLLEELKVSIRAPRGEASANYTPVTGNRDEETHKLSNKLRVPVVIRMHRDCNIGKHRFWTCGGHSDEPIKCRIWTCTSNGLPELCIYLSESISGYLMQYIFPTSTLRLPPSMEGISTVVADSKSMWVTSLKERYRRITLTRIEDVNSTIPDPRSNSAEWNTNLRSFYLDRWDRHCEV